MENETTMMAQLKMSDVLVAVKENKLVRDTDCVILVVTPKEGCAVVQVAPELLTTREGTMLMLAGPAFSELCDGLMREHPKAWSVLGSWSARHFSVNRISFADFLQMAEDASNEDDEDEAVGADAEQMD